MRQQKSITSVHLGISARLLVNLFNLFLLAAFGLALSACGRKGELEPIDKTDYPRQYPAQYPDCSV